MSPTERALWARVQRHAAALQPELAADLLRAFRQLADQLSEMELRVLMRSGTLERLFAGPLDQASLDVAFAPFRNRLRAGVLQAARRTVRDLPKPAQTSSVAFDFLHPNVVQGIQTLETRVLTRLQTDVRKTVRQVVAQGLQEGKGPRAIARELRPVLGLAPNQLDAIQNFRGLLEAGDREALQRALRDRRFDATVDRLLGPGKPGLTEAQIDTMIEAYGRRMVAFNAETHARTAALDAQKLGQRLSWDQAVARGDVDGDRLRKRWAGVRDTREREEHWEMDHRADDGEAPRYDEPYSNGEMIPGESTYNCRCISIYFLARVA